MLYDDYPDDYFLRDQSAPAPDQQGDPFVVDDEWDPFTGWRWNEGIDQSNRSAALGMKWKWMGFDPAGSRAANNDYGWQQVYNIAPGSQVNTDGTITPTPTPPPTTNNPPTTDNPYTPDNDYYPTSNYPTGGYGDTGSLSALAGTFGGGSGPRAQFSPVPEFTAPVFQAPPEFRYDKAAPGKFQAPTAADMQNEPGFQFRMAQGQKALEQSAAGRGVLRTGGTLKNLVDYGQNFASNEYGNVYNRRAGEYDREFNAYKFDYDKEADTYAKNYNIKRDVFDRDFQGKVAEFQPKMTGWQVNSNADQRAAEQLFQREWDQYVFGNDEAWRNKNFAYQQEQDELDRAAGLYT